MLLELIILGALQKPVPKPQQYEVKSYREIYLRDDQKIAQLGKNPDANRKY